MPSLRFVPMAVAELNTFFRPWLSLSNTLGDGTLFATPGPGSGTVLRAIRFGAWRTQSAAIPIAEAIPENAVVLGMSARITAKSSAPALVQAYWSSNEGNYDFAGSLGSALTSSFAQHSIAPLLAVTNGVLSALRTGQTGLALDVEMTGPSDELGLQRVYLDIDFAEPRHVVFNGQKPTALALGANPISALWYNGLRMWP